MIGYIYKIYSDKSNLIYIGSTCKNVKARIAVHVSQNLKYIKNMYKKYKEDLKKPTIYPIFINDMKYTILDKFEIESKADLIKKEGEFVKMYKTFEDIEILNKYIPGRDSKTYYQDNKQQKKEYQINYYKSKKNSPV